MDNNLCQEVIVEWQTGLHVFLFSFCRLLYLWHEKFSIDEVEKFNPYKPSVLFIWHRQTVQNQTGRRRLRRLIRLSTVCLQNVLLQLQ